MINDLPLRWGLTGLFVFSAVTWWGALRATRHPWTSAVASGLHLAMAIAMAIMAWPWGAQLPTTGPAVFFLLAGLWFVALTVGSGRMLVQRAMYGYHALMMLAMSCMYLVMQGHCYGEWGTHHHALHGMSMPNTDMAAINMLASSGSPRWVIVLNGIWMLTFCAATVFWVYRFFTQRQRSVAPCCHTRNNVGQAAMSAGMALMFGVLLFQI